MMKVSILIPVYGVEKYVEHCAISLFEQTYGNVEYVFVDDCTKDDSIAVLRNVLQRYPNRARQVKIVRHIVNRGLAAARNTALDNATGDYLMHVDGDDYLELEAVELLVNRALETGADIVACDSFSVYKNKKQHISYNLPTSKEKYIEALLEKKISPCIWGKLFSAKFVHASGVRSIEGLNHGEDYVTVPRLVYYADKIVRLPLPLYNYVQYNEGAYTKNITQKSIDNMVWADTVLEDFFLRTPDKEKYRTVMITAKLRTKINLLKRGNKALFKRIIALYPDITNSYRNSLSFRDRMLLSLIENGFYRLGLIYIRLGLFIYRIK